MNIVGDKGIAFGGSGSSYEQVSQLQALVLFFETSLCFGGHFSRFSVERQVVYSRQELFPLGSALSGFFAARVSCKELTQHQFVEGYVRNDNLAFLKPGQGLQSRWFKTYGRDQEVCVQNVLAHQADFLRITLAKASASLSVKESRSFATHAFMAGSLKSYLSNTLLRGCGGEVLPLAKTLTAIA